MSLGKTVARPPRYHRGRPASATTFPFLNTSARAAWCSGLGRRLRLEQDQIRARALAQAVLPQPHRARWEGRDHVEHFLKAFIVRDAHGPIAPAPPDFDQVRAATARPDVADIVVRQRTSTPFDRGIRTRSSSERLGTHARWIPTSRISSRTGRIFSRGWKPSANEVARGHLVLEAILARLRHHDRVINGLSGAWSR